MAAKALGCSMFNTDRCTMEGVLFFIIPSSYNAYDSTLIHCSGALFILLEHISFCALYKSAINYVTEKQDSGASQKRISFLTEEEVNSVNKHYITVYIFASSIQITVNYRLKILTVENHIKRKGPVQFSHKYDFRSSSPAHIKNQSYVVVLFFFLSSQRQTTGDVPSKN